MGCIICLLAISKRLYEYFSWAKEGAAVYTSNTRPTDDTLRVLMIGDSWAAYHLKSGNDTVLTSMLQNKLNQPICVNSSGMVGAKTKAIYELMSDTIRPIGTRNLIDRKPDYCIISAGINDAVAKMGTKNYCYHYGLIIRHLLSAGIKPIVLDMPDVDYKFVFQKESIISKIRHYISSCFTKAPMWTFKDYRKELYLMICQNGLKDHIIYIPSKDWNPTGFEDPRDLYLEDHIHLNNKGYYLMDSCIVSFICRDYISTRDSL